MTERPTFAELVARWGPDVRMGPPRPGTHRNEVRTVVVRDVECVGRRSDRCADSLAWEHSLLDALAAEGVAVPRPLPTAAGATQVGGLVLTPKLRGDHPDSAADWAAVAAMLRQVHEIAADRPQRPDLPDWTAGPVAVRAWAGAAGLDADLALAYAAARAELPGPTGVLAGRTRRRDLTMTEAGPAVVDWDESRVDTLLLDLVGDPALAGSAEVPPELRAALERCADRWTELRGLPRDSTTNTKEGGT